MIRRTAPAAAAPTYPPAAQLEVLAARLAKIAKVPANYQHDFSEHILRTVLGVRERDRRSTGVRPGGLLPKAADAARTLQDAFCQMNRHDREWVEHIKKTQVKFIRGEVDDLETAIVNIASVLHAALGKRSTVLKPPKRDPRYALYQQLGMLAPRVKNQPLRELVFGLLHAAQDTGGRFDFNKNSESGALAEALRLLRDGNYLPSGLVPSPLPATTIQRLKNEFVRLSR
jgi:hypothetical protein